METRVENEGKILQSEVKEALRSLEIGKSARVDEIK